MRLTILKPGQVWCGLIMTLALAPAAAAAAQTDFSCFAAAGAKARGEVAIARRSYARLPASEVGQSTDIKRLALLRLSDQAARSWLEHPTSNCNLNTLNSNLDDPTVKSLVGLMFETDRWDQSALRAILDRIGWPVISKYGKEADQSAFLVVQHATNDPAFQRAVLAKLEMLVAPRETSAENYALLFDRVQVGARKPQRFGSQGQCRRSDWVPDPIENPSSVDQRRAKLGLSSLAEYRNKVASIYCRS